MKTRHGLIGTHKHSRAFCALMLCAFMLRSFVPVGYMPDWQAVRLGQLKFELCPARAGGSTALSHHSAGLPSQRHVPPESALSGHEAHAGNLGEGDHASNPEEHGRSDDHGPRSMGGEPCGFAASSVTINGAGGLAIFKAASHAMIAGRSIAIRFELKRERIASQLGSRAPPHA